MSPVVLASLFDPLTPRTLVDAIAECLRYHPRHRITPRELLRHAYFTETVPKIQAAPYIPAMPDAPVRPTALPPTPTAVQQQQQPHLPSASSSPGGGTTPALLLDPSTVQNVPNRDLPPSHSVAGFAAAPPGFSLVDPNRTLPPLQSSGGGGQRVPFFPQYRDVSSPVMPPTPSSASSRSVQSPPLHPSPYDSPGLEPHALSNQRRTTGASALVDQLKRLDLPAAELSSYGRRAPPSGVARAAGQEPPQWPGGPSGGGGGGSGNYPYDLSASSSYYSRPSGQSSTSIASSGHGSSSSHLVQSTGGLPSPGLPSPHGRPYDDDVSMPPPSSTVVQHQLPHERVRRLDPVAANAEVEAARKAALAPKKKKWGLSSVFGSNNDSKASHSLVSVAEEASRSSSVPLKRTQSVSDRADSNTSLTSGETHTDPKQAAKEAKKQAKALEMAKRDAAEKASRERARAVMMKRERMVEATAEHYKNKASGLGGKTVPANYLIPSSSSSLGLQSPSTTSVNQRPPPQARSAAASQRLPSDLGKDSLLSGHRHKSRRRDLDDDHSTSSLDANSLRSPSIMTFHSVDSDPGPSRLARQYSSSVGVDPALGVRGSSYQTNSQGSNSSPQLYSLPQGSGSIENQLSNDFRQHARLASNSPAASYASPLGSTFNPYGRGGSEASSLKLPSVASLDLNPEQHGNGYINPMFHVVRNPSSSFLSPNHVVLTSLLLSRSAIRPTATATIRPCHRSLSSHLSRTVVINSIPQHINTRKHLLFSTLTVSHSPVLCLIPLSSPPSHTHPSHSSILALIHCTFFSCPQDLLKACTKPVSSKVPSPNLSPLDSFLLILHRTLIGLFWQSRERDEAGLPFLSRRPTQVAKRVRSSNAKLSLLRIVTL